MDAVTIRERATEAIKFWEPMRLVYNGVLAVIVLLYFRLGLPNSTTYISTNGFSVLIVLAVLANVAYCAAYAVDLFAQLSGFREQWRTARWGLFSIGLLFASILTRFFSMGMFGVT
jgi:hypothetical protein